METKVMWASVSESVHPHMITCELNTPSLTSTEAADLISTVHSRLQQSALLLIKYQVLNQQENKRVSRNTCCRAECAQLSRNHKNVKQMTN
eukprot:6814426-Pyramimonas_sp.AAC.1